MIRIKKPKIGLALGSGAAKGLAHIGVLKALKEENISINMVAGSSMGAFVGACYARKGEIADLEEIVVKIDWKQLARLADPNLALLFKGVIHGKKIKELLKTIIGDVEFKDLKVPLAVVATDVNTGEEVVIKEGSVIEAVRASISMPVIFMPVKIRDRFLIDGGIVNPVPVSVVKNMGATFVIACNVIHRLQERKPRSRTSAIGARLPSVGQRFASGRKNSDAVALNNKINTLVQKNKDRFENLQKFIIDPNTPNVFDTLLQAIYAMEYELAKSKIKGADIVITPEVGYLATLEFHRGIEAISDGYEAAMKVRVELKRRI